MTKHAIETAYSFLHQKQQVYVHSRMETQRDDIEYAVATFAESMHPNLLEQLAAGKPDFLRDHQTFPNDLTHAVETLENWL